jgi:hypothetical protein
MNKQTRGERNNNPGNIERNNTHWQGMSADQTGDTRFVAFDRPEDGIRALAKVLLNYQRVHHLDTVQDIIDRWAPNSENDTSAYVHSVCTEMGVGAETCLDLHDAALLESLTRAIIRHENGRVIYPAETLEAAVDAALGA